MFRTKILVPTIAVALLAGACSSFEERYQASLPPDQRHPIEVSTEVAVLDVDVDSRGALTPTSRSRVDIFMRTYKAEGNGVLEIQTASGGTDVATAQIRDLALVNGIARNKLAERSFRPNDGSGSRVRVAFARYVASVPSCAKQDWSENLGQTWDNTPYASFGCATQMNVAAQVADPRDVIAAKPLDPGSADRRGTIFDKFEKGERTASQGDEKENATISIVAQ